MPNNNFRSDDFHRERLLKVRMGDVVLDSEWQDFHGFEVKVVAIAGARTVDRSTWFTDMVFGGQATNSEDGREVA